MITLEPVIIPAEIVNQVAGAALALNPRDPQHAAAFILRQEVARIIRDLEDPACLVETVRAYDRQPAVEPNATDATDASNVLALPAAS